MQTHINYNEVFETKTTLQCKVSVGLNELFHNEGTMVIALPSTYCTHVDSKYSTHADVVLRKVNEDGTLDMKRDVALIQVVVGKGGTLRTDVHRYLFINNQIGYLVNATTYDNTQPVSEQCIRTCTIDLPEELVAEDINTKLVKKLKSLSVKTSSKSSSAGKRQTRNSWIPTVSEYAACIALNSDEELGRVWIPTHFRDSVKDPFLGDLKGVSGEQKGFTAADEINMSGIDVSCHNTSAYDLPSSMVSAIDVKVDYYSWRSKKVPIECYRLHGNEYYKHGWLWDDSIADIAYVTNGFVYVVPRIKLQELVNNEKPYTSHNIKRNKYPTWGNKDLYDCNYILDIETLAKMATRISALPDAYLETVRNKTKAFLELGDHTNSQHDFLQSLHTEDIAYL